MNESMNEWINQSMNQSMNQSNKHSINQSIHQSIKQSWAARHAPHVAEADVADEVDHVLELEDVAHEAAVLVQVQPPPLVRRHDAWFTGVGMGCKSARQA